MAAVRDELSESKVCLREQIAELGTVAQERDLSFSAEMKQKEAETEQREADFRARIQEKEQEMDRREASFRAELAEKEQLLALSDAEMCASREADTAQHRQQLGDMEASLRQTEVEASDRVGVLQAQHQTELAEKDELFRLKELHAHENLESVKKLHQAQLEEKERAVARKLVQKDAETNEMLESLRIVHQTHLHEKDATISQKDVDARDSIESIRRMHQAQVSNMEELLQQKDVDMKEGLGSLKAMHQAQLHELEERLKRKDADSKDSTASIKSWHQAQISKMEELIKQKDADMQESMESMRNVHQAQLFEKEELLSQKDASLKEEISSLKRSHQSQLDEKDELLQQKESSFREALESMKLQHQARVDEAEENLRQKDAYLRESLQSNQLLQSSSSEQLKLEQQRVQRLEAEVQSLRALEEDLRAGATVTTRQAERLEAELSSSRDQLLELRSTLQRSETEREQQLERASERQATLQEENIQLKVKVGVLQEELAGVKASAKAKGEQVDRLEQHRDSLEVEFRSYKEHHGTSNLQQMEAITELRLTVDKLSKQVDFTKIELTAQQGSLGQQQGYIQSLQNDLANGESIRRELHNTIQELKGNIRVFCRVRPHLEGEDAAKALQSPEAGKLNLNHMGENYNFAFDRVFDDSSTQEAVFDEVSGLVQSALDGYKVCIFAYGQTGSGKTYTMQGSQERSSWGLIPRALSKIFQASETMRSAGWEWTLRASFLEVYNEALRDLLTGTSDSSSSGLVHVIKHDDAWGTMVTNLTSVQVESLDHIHKLMEKASKSRAVGSTDMNATSSRSHSVFALYLHGVNRELNSELHGALHLVDLAGSERLDRSGATGERLKETQNINRSLSSLADVFLAKAEGRSHVPFRNSKLTHLMEPCLNGQGKTLMVVNVGPEQDNSHETLCALRFAGQVSHCNTGGKPKRSTRPASAAVAAPSRLQSPALSLRPQSAASAATAAQTLRRAGR
ncbi:unnamed protein product [Polarella glacialis]|nr:unnamed protein product [Polarella glacialis]